MVELFKILITILALLLGWVLSEIGYYLRIRKGDKRQVNKLLFNLLELRCLLSKSIELDKSIDYLVTKYKEKTSPEHPGQSNLEIDFIRPVIKELLKDKIVEPKQIECVEHTD